MLDFGSREVSYSDSWLTISVYVSASLVLCLSKTSCIYIIDWFSLHVRQNHVNSYINYSGSLLRCTVDQVLIFIHKTRANINTNTSRQYNLDNSKSLNIKVYWRCYANTWLKLTLRKIYNKMSKFQFSIVYNRNPQYFTDVWAKSICF